MKLILEINDQVKSRLSKNYFEKVIKKTIERSNIESVGNIDLSLAVVPEKEIKKVNSIYRKKNKITDILSFSDYSKKENGKIKKEGIFCELIICYPYIRKSAETDGISIKKEMAYVISHGMLHCLGFDHSKKMYEIQDEVCKNF